MRTSDQIGLEEWFKPILDAVLGLTIDLSIDAIAIRVDGGFWTWKNIPLEALPTFNGFFGVNYRNFIGWFLVILIFSYLLRFGQKLLYEEKNLSKRVIIGYFCTIPFVAYLPLYLAYILSTFFILPLLIIDYFLKINISFLLSEQCIALVILISILSSAGLMQIIAFDSRTKIEKNVDWISIIIFSYFHGIYLVFYFASGIFREVPLLFPLVILMLTISTLIHWSISDRKQIKYQIDFSVYKIKNLVKKI